MLQQLLTEIRSIRPTLALPSRIVLEAVLLAEGPVGSADAVSRFLGLHNRFELGRRLKRDGLPSLHHLAAWAMVLSWVQRAERDGLSLCKLAYRSHRHPSACYRLVRETTGLRWAEVRARGSTWVRRHALEQFPPSARIPLHSPHLTA
jgi:hypothetical protein